MKFWDFFTKHLSECIIGLLTVIALILIIVAFKCNRPCGNNGTYQVRIDSTQVVKVKPVNDSIR